MDFNLTKKRLVVILTILILYFIPPIVIGEVLYSYDRNHNYEDLSDFESVKIESQSELQLWYTNSYEKVILIVHGHNDHSSLMYTRYSAIFESLNLDMVFVDLRNHGRSGDHGPITMGIDEANDITEVLLWMNNLWDEIILFGTSMGAISNLLAMNSENIGDIRDKVSHIIFDSMFTSFDSAIDNTLRKYFIPKFWHSLTREYLNLRTSERETPNIISEVQKINQIPLLFLMGTKDRIAPSSAINPIINLNQANIDYQLINDGEHSRLYRHDNYQLVIQNFLT